MTIRFLVRLAALLACLPFAAADAQTLYKLIDKNGKVTYSEKPPKDFDGKVIRMDINPEANKATLPKYQPKSEAAGGAGAEDAVRAARERLESARKALAEARENPGEGDVVRLGKKGGGTRPEPTEDYRKRLEALEQAVKDAERDLRSAERR